MCAKLCNMVTGERSLLMNLMHFSGMERGHLFLLPKTRILLVVSGCLRLKETHMGPLLDIRHALLQKASLSAQELIFRRPLYPLFVLRPSKLSLHLLLETSGRCTNWMLTMPSSKVPFKNKFSWLSPLVSRIHNIQIMYASYIKLFMACDKPRELGMMR